MSALDHRGSSRRPVDSAGDEAPASFGRTKVHDHHRDRLAMVYIRQSTPRQVRENVESTALQYELSCRARALGWPQDRVLVIDDDLGQSGRSAAQRPGFQRLLAEVGLNHVGLVLGIEMSRLARSCKDWYQLLELCGLFGTLIADQDGVYDLADYNDRLLLGLKGTMSEAELHVMRSRLDQGRLHKAARGELFTRLPVGYVLLPDGDVAFDPDEQVRAVIRLVFEKMTELGSARAVLRYLLRQQIRLPQRPHNGPHVPPLQWCPPTADRVYRILKNPTYAGTYAYGRRTSDPKRKRPDQAGYRLVALPLERWDVLLRDRLPAYLSWEQYLANRERLRQNVARWDRSGAPRQGAALLSGLVQCGRCGQRMQVHYPGARRPWYGCCRPDRRGEQKDCPGLPAAVLDALVSRQVLRALEPAALELSLQAQEDLDAERQRLHRDWQQRRERARYQAERARRQYEAVEPENRLVARELELRWEGALRQQRQVEEDYARFQQQQPACLSAAERQAIRALARDIPQVWDAATTTAADRKIVIRQLVERVRVQVRGTSEVVDVAIHWKGGVISPHTLDRPVQRYEQLGGYERLLERVRGLRQRGQKAMAIAERLNAEGFRTTKNKPYTAALVRKLLSRQGLSRARSSSAYPEGCGRDEWWLGDLARELGLSLNGLTNWIRRGWVHARQLSGAGGSWILWADADELVRLRRLREQRQRPFLEELTTPRPRPSPELGPTQKGRSGDDPGAGGGRRRRRRKARCVT
jgi:DNA invertase Pin-like site-specific DNA recombinase